MLKGFPRVIDAYCGCGGDAIAMAESGLAVTAIERDSSRLKFARQNAASRGVEDRIDFVLGDVEEVLPGILERHPGAAVYLDPPWGGVDWDRGRQTYDSLVPEAVTQVCGRAAQVLMKAPRALDPSSLPDLGQGWRLRPAWAPGHASPAERLIFLRAIAHPDHCQD